MKTIALAVIESGEITARICTSKSDIGIRSGEVLVEFSGRHLDFGDGQLARLVEESQVQRLKTTTRAPGVPSAAKKFSVH